MTQPLKNDSAVKSEQVYICPAPNCSNFYKPFGNGGRVVSGCSPACSTLAKRNTGTTVIELEAAPQEATNG